MHLSNILNGKLNRKKKTKSSWLVTTIKQILKMPIQKFDKSIFWFKIKNKAAARNRKLLAAFNGYLGAEIKAQKGSPLNYGSEICDISELSKLSIYHKDKRKIINISQQGSCYDLSPIYKETRKSDLVLSRPGHPNRRGSVFKTPVGIGMILRDFGPKKHEIDPLFN